MEVHLLSVYAVIIKHERGYYLPKLKNKWTKIAKSRDTDPLLFVIFLICFYDIQKVTVLLPFEKCG